MVRSVVIEDHPNYELHSDGTVWRIGSQRGPLAIDISNRYVCVKLDGKNVCVHRLMGKYFVQKIDGDESFIFHIDGNYANNSEENLVWVNGHELGMLRKYVGSVREEYARRIQGGEEVDLW